MGFSQHNITTRYTQVLADYICSAQYEDFPPEVIERAKMIITQVLGVSLAAADMEETAKVIQLAKLCNTGGSGEATAWVDGSRMSMENAVLISGAVADMLDWEDCSWTGHPSCAIVPVAWTVCEALGLTGKDLITAVIVGYEVYQRIAMALQPTMEERVKNGWGLTSWQIFGAIVPAVKLMGLDALSVNKALSMGTTCSVIPTCFHEFTKSDVYHFEHGFRNHTGITLARAAKLGVENLEDGIDDPGAFGSHFTKEEKTEWYTKELGSRYLIMDTLLKHWPANMWCQSSTEIGYDLVTRNNIAPEDIEEIIIKPGTFRRMDISDGFSSITRAQFSIPFVMAAMICNREPGAHWYTQENMNDPKVIDLAKRVRGSDEPEDSPSGGFKMFVEGSYPDKTVIIKTKDGKSVEGSMRCHPGHPDNMMTRQQFAERFRVQASPVLSEEKREQAIQALFELENCSDVASLSWMLHR